AGLHGVDADQTAGQRGETDERGGRGNHARPLDRRRSAAVDAVERHGDGVEVLISEKLERFCESDALDDLERAAGEAVEERPTRGAVAFDDQHAVPGRRLAHDEVPAGLTRAPARRPDGPGGAGAAVGATRPPSLPSAAPRSPPRRPSRPAAW